ncbi:hypothetical protein CC80DRAFT_503832 [Byssothecium circinans]|uniref:Uncharacterized protein n=1 Tax=Byssothecium circinans TaxID=147558 RepID=A0A6A5U0M8_9PLEO|nr:hypothetical protein CC80DRAFT_503832 [Byssothecium circinans]
MPPKKTTAAAAATGAGTEADGAKKINWNPEQDRKLLLLCFERSSLTTDDYNSFLPVMGTGATYNGVRLRIGKLRGEAREFREANGLTVPNGAAAGAGKTTPNATPKGKKRGVDDSGDANGDGTPAKPAKKARAKKAAKVPKVEEIVDEDGPSNDLGGQVNGQNVKEQKVNSQEAKSQEIKEENIDEYFDI